MDIPSQSPASGSGWIIALAGPIALVLSLVLLGLSSSRLINSPEVPFVRLTRADKTDERTIVSSSQPVVELPAAAERSAGEFSLEGLLASIDQTTDRLTDPALVEFVAVAPDRLPQRPHPTPIDPSQRWVVAIPEGLTQAAYTAMLDSLQIELGVVISAKRVQYASSFTRQKSQLREGSTTAEDRLYLSFSSGDLVEVDRALVALAGIEVGTRPVLHFIHPRTEEKMAQAEADFAKCRPEQIALTRFSVRPQPGNGWEFYVVEQTLLD